MDNYIAHYGIRGQKWGVKHGPPYPLKSDVSRLVRRSRSNVDHAKKYDDYHDTEKTSKLIKDQVNTKETLTNLKRLSRKEPVKVSLNKVNPDVHGEGRNWNCQNSSTAFELRRRGYDVEARRLDDGSNLGNMEKWFKNGKFTTINDKKNSNDPFYKFPEKINNLNTNSPEFKAFKNEWRKRQRNAYRDFCREISKQPVGSRGIWFAGWQLWNVDHSNLNLRYAKRKNQPVRISPTRGAFFHAMNYEIKSDGPIFYDSQSKRNKMWDSYNWNIYGVDPREYSYMRTDNLELDPSVVEAVISRKR